MSANISPLRLQKGACSHKIVHGPHGHFEVVSAPRDRHDFGSSGCARRVEVSRGLIQINGQGPWLRSHPPGLRQLIVEKDMPLQIAVASPFAVIIIEYLHAEACLNPAVGS